MPEPFTSRLRFVASCQRVTALFQTETTHREFILLENWHYHNPASACRRWHAMSALILVALLSIGAPRGGPHVDHGGVHGPDAVWALRMNGVNFNFSPESFRIFFLLEVLARRYVTEPAGGSPSGRHLSLFTGSHFGFLLHTTLLHTR